MSFVLLSAVKVLTSVIIILVATELSKKSTIVAAVVLALPIVSIISLTWIWLETKDINKITNLSLQIFWVVLPSLPMFLILPFLLSKDVGFFLSLVSGMVVTVILFYISQKLL